MANKLHYKSILVVTYGRSGSTLLQGIINSIDGCLLRGENNNFCYKLFSAYKDINISKTQSNADTPEHPWFGAPHLNSDDLIIKFREILKKQLVPENNSAISCYGFKEIRYLHTDINEDFSDYLDFLSKLLPNPLIIFNTRDIEDVSRSGWWKDIKRKTTVRLLTDAENNFTKYAQKNTDIFTISYNDILDKSDNLKKLFIKIGADYDENKIDKILSKNHSYIVNETVNKNSPLSIIELTGGKNSQGSLFLAKEEEYRTKIKNNSYAKLAAPEMMKRALIHSPFSKKAILVLLKHYTPYLKNIFDRNQQHTK